jgi:hypothetical protein
MPKLLKFTSFEHKFFVETIIDARSDQSKNVGLLVDNLKTESVEFEDEINKSLFDLFHFALKPTENAIPIIVKINELEYNKKYFGKGFDKELVWMFADYEIFVRQKDGRYFRLTHVQDLVEAIIPDESYGVNFAELTWIFWNKAFSEVQGMRLLPKPNSIFVDETEMEIPISRPPILRDSIIKGGIYMSYNEFLNNSPSITDIGIDSTGVYLRNIKTNKFEAVRPIDNIWGFSDGYNLFVNHKNQCDYIPLERVGTTFEIAKAAPKPYILFDDDVTRRQALVATSMLYRAVTYREMQFIIEQGLSSSGGIAISFSAIPKTTWVNTANFVGAGILLAIIVLNNLSKKSERDRLILKNGGLKPVARYAIIR